MSTQEQIKKIEYISDLWVFHRINTAEMLRLIELLTEEKT